MDIWKLKTDKYNHDDTVLNGNRFLTGNGYMGCRGTMDEWGRREMAAINLAGIYDQNGDKWREPVNAPNALFAVFTVDGKQLFLGKEKELAHSQSVSYRNGLHARETEFSIAYLKSERFVSMENKNLLVSRLTLIPKTDGAVELLTGIVTDIWDINGPHLFNYDYNKDDIFVVKAVTGQLGIPIAVSQGIYADFDCNENRYITDTGIYRNLSFEVREGEQYTVTLYSVVLTGQDCQKPHVKVFDITKAAVKNDFDYHFNQHVQAWELIWQRSVIELDGSEEAAHALNASLYHLHSIAPRHTDNLSIPARGLSGQTYKGAIFWDSELFMLPVFTLTEPEVARSLLRYRVETLTGALAKAEEYGYRGAFYPWESQEGGLEGCTDYNVIDVFTHRPVRTYFRDKQIHISGDIAFAFWRYFDITGDINVLKDGGAEVILQCARFYLSRSHQRVDNDKIELLDVVGPDEYHERVNNNVFTNQIAAACMSYALEVKRVFEENDPEFINNLIGKLDYAGDYELLSEVYQRLRCDFKDGGLIEQFDGYFALEDSTPDIVRSRLLHEREYWGTNHGVASQTQVIKQADVIAMIALFPELFSDLTARVNWEYYEPRTEHGSSLSACMYALVACRIGKPELAWPLFIKAATIDVLGSGKNWAGDVYIGGTHPAGNGSAWIITVQGFAGLSIIDGEIKLNPHLPEQIKSLRFPITLRGKHYNITITHDGWKVN